MLTLSGAEVRAVLLGGFSAGTADIGAACLIYFTAPMVIMKAIAGGLIGPASFQGGAATAALGLALQWLMSCLIAAIYVVATLKWPMLRRRWIASGLAFGAVVFGVMNYGVAPLSAIGKFPAFTVALFIANLVAMLMFGLIITFFARHTTRTRPPGA